MVGAEGEAAGDRVEAAGACPRDPAVDLLPRTVHRATPLARGAAIIHPAADNATATAYRTKRVVVVPATMPYVTLATPPAALMKLRTDVLSE